MKLFFRSILIGLLSLFAASAIAQETDNSFFSDNGEIVVANLPTSIPLDEREPVEYNNPRADDIIWQKVVYRIIDLREKINYPLYFPEEASDNRQSLFTSIFRLYEEGKIKAYAYLDNKEIFTEENLIPFDEFVKTCDILLTVHTDSITGDTLSTEIDESNIPNREILKYYAKEVWYFDKHNSVFNVRLIALCPIWYKQDYDLGLQKRPLFFQTSYRIFRYRNGSRSNRAKGQSLSYPLSSFSQAQRLRRTVFRRLILRFHNNGVYFRYKQATYRQIYKLSTFFSFFTPH